METDDDIANVAHLIPVSAFPPEAKLQCSAVLTSSEEQSAIPAIFLMVEVTHQGITTVNGAVCCIDIRALWAAWVNDRSENAKYPSPLTPGLVYHERTVGALNRRMQNCASLADRGTGKLEWLRSYMARMSQGKLALVIRVGGLVVGHQFYQCFRWLMSPHVTNALFSATQLFAEYYSARNPNSVTAQSLLYTIEGINARVSYELGNAMNIVREGRDGSTIADMVSNMSERELRDRVQDSSGMNYFSELDLDSVRRRVRAMLFRNMSELVSGSSYITVTLSALITPLGILIKHGLFWGLIGRLLTVLGTALWNVLSGSWMGMLGGSVAVGNAMHMVLAAVPYMGIAMLMLRTGLLLYKELVPKHSELHQAIVQLLPVMEQITENAQSGSCETIADEERAFAAAYVSKCASQGTPAERRAWLIAAYRAPTVVADMHAPVDVLKPYPIASRVRLESVLGNRPGHKIGYSVPWSPATAMKKSSPATRLTARAALTARATTPSADFTTPLSTTPFSTTPSSTTSFSTTSFSTTPFSTTPSSTTPFSTTPSSTTPFSTTPSARTSPSTKTGTKRKTPPNRGTPRKRM
jgi:hypothetical protein